jgi:hypothetical protein
MQPSLSIDGRAATSRTKVALRKANQANGKRDGTGDGMGRTRLGLLPRLTVGGEEVLPQQAEVAVDVLALWVVREERLHSVGARQEWSVVAGQLLRSGHHRDATKVRIVVVVAPSGKPLVCEG